MEINIMVETSSVSLFHLIKIHLFWTRIIDFYLFFNSMLHWTKWRYL